MSASEKALSAVKMVFTYQERMDAIAASIASVSERLERLADSHANLRDRVSRIEGAIDGYNMAQSAQKRLPKD